MCQSNIIADMNSSAGIQITALLLGPGVLQSAFTIMFAYINWLSVLINLPFIVVVFIANIAQNPKRSNTALKVFCIMTAFWVVGLWITFGSAWASRIIQWPAALPHFVFTAYFVTSVVAYGLQHHLLGKLSAGLFGFLVLTLIAVSIWVVILFQKRHSKASERLQKTVALVKQDYQSAADAMLKIKHAAATAQTVVPEFLENNRTSIKEALTKARQVIFDWIKGRESI